jgi:hypothetical protein
MRVVLLLLLAMSGSTHSGEEVSPGFVPLGSPAELSDLTLLARLRAPGVQPIAFSSYDRTGGNNDGFQGTYSKLRLEEGNSVLAEIAGPGVIQRIWFTHTTDKRPGLLDGKHEHLKIYLDQSEAPALDVPLERVFDGTHPQFPRPLVFEGSGGYVSYVPIPFRKGCKVVVEGKGVRFYQINLVALPADADVTSFREPADPERLRQLAEAASLWTTAGTPDTGGTPGPDLAVYEVECLANSEIVYGLRAGPATVRSIQVRPAPGFEAAWRAARLRFTWDGAGQAGVDVPLGHFFGWSEGAIPCRSLLVGDRDGVWYSRFPMPYRREAALRIDTPAPLKGVIEVRTRGEIAPDAGYFRASFRQSHTSSGTDFPWLQEQGRGHFAGVFSMTQGKAKLPYWLEGDDRFRVDGRLAIHGTGSEDYFNCGWYALPGRLDRPATYPLHGFPVYRQVGESWQAAAYRWHLADPMPFFRSIDAGIEHGGDNQFPADYRAVVFWYSDRPCPAALEQRQTAE